MSFANVFLQSVACLFILMTLSIAEQKILILMKSSLSVISFMNCAFGIVSEKSSPNSRSFGLSLMLSSRSFIVLCFTLRSMIHFELIFVKGVRLVQYSKSISVTHHINGIKKNNMITSVNADRKSVV